MPLRTEKDFWVEMSIREIRAQARFAGIAYGNIDPKALKGNEAVFSSIHSFLSHCAMVSKMFKATDDANPPKFIGDVLGVRDTSAIHKRAFRNHLEHYDERLKKWISRFGLNVNIGTYNIGPKSAIQVPNLVFVSHYDPDTYLFTFVNEEFDLSVLYLEVKRIENLADTWVKSVESRIISTPYI